MSNQNPNEEYIIDQMIKDKAFRMAMVRKSHYWFFHYYFGRKYARYPTADFQREIFNITENPDLQNIVITAFRGSAKSTIITLSYVIWSIVGVKQKKFIVILGHTQLNTHIHLNAIKKELEENNDFRRDFGPFKEEIDQNGIQSILLPQYGANISIRSIGQNIRGIKHFQYRPELIIADDLEDLDSVKTLENRNKMFDWLTSDVIPAGDRNTQFIFIGTPLHHDSILMRLEKIFQNGDPRNIFRKFPIVDENNIPLWPGKFKISRDIEDEKTKCFNELAWQREYLLNIVESDYQIIKREWIRYYDVLPKDLQHRASAVAIDLGVKQGELNDPTAIVCGDAYGYGAEGKIYISPDFFNRKISFSDIIGKAKEFSLKLGRARIIVEDVAAQNYAIQQIRTEGFFVEGFVPRGDKSERLTMISPLIQNGQVVFHRSCEAIINQIVNFGVERHDDLADALVMLVMTLIKIIGHNRSGRVPIGSPRGRSGPPGEPHHNFSGDMRF